ncbi:c-type cytochrome [Dyella flagellata]|uniref:Alcohol dehydrogenase n=1 Tax=Dyella flagellata TaxID=1867833 RepID=A0ABQ5XA15_9GAMM|nr:cytochrome c [Dyella flagellata]GLQ87499.1 alcohol dehydrogenase [Dyella flagellata]
MKRFLLVLVILVLIGAGAYLYLNRSDSSTGTAPAIAGAPPTANVLARGEYLTKAADCAACHSVPGSGKAFAGGVPFRLPFGTIYSSNITADAATGIGSWSDDDFVRALHDGIGKGGEHLYPAFPYSSYTLLSRSDVLAIKAYLFSLPKISQPNRLNDLSFPYNQRWAIGFWNAAFFKSQRFQPDAAQSAQWNSGKYLATALGHCAECHTPRNAAFALDHSQEFSGEVLQGWRAYNITSDPVHGIGAWSDGDIASYFSTGHADGHGSASGPMAEAVENSLRFLQPPDTGALVAYLRSAPALAGKDPIAVDAKPAPALASSDYASSGDAQADAQGLKLFEGACASCHQWNGKGQQTPYASLLGARGVNDVHGSNITQVLLHGSSLRGEGANVFMPGFGNAYSNTEIAALSNYVIGHFGNKQGTVTPDDVAERRKQL